MHAWTVPRLNIACIRLKILKMTAVFQQESLRIGNFCKRANVRSEHSRDAKSNKITLTININSQFPACSVMVKQRFFLWKSENLGLALVDL